MELHKIIEDNTEIMDTISRECDIPTLKLVEVVSEVTPTLVSGIRETAKNESEIEMFFDEFESDHFDEFLAKPELLVNKQAIGKGNDVLEHVLKSKEVTRILADLVGEKSGVDAIAVRKVLPLVATVLMGVLTKVKLEAVQGGQSVETITEILDENRDGTMWNEVVNLGSKWFR